MHVSQCSYQIFTIWRIMVILSKLTMQSLCVNHTYPVPVWMANSYSLCRPNNKFFERSVIYDIYDIWCDAWYNIGYDIGYGNWCGICYDIYMMYCIWYIWYGIIQSSAVKTRSNIERFCIKNCRNWDMISIRCWIHKIHPIPRLNGRVMGCLLWIFVIKLTAL